MRIEPKEIKTEFEKILDYRMRSLLGGRNWSVWRTDIEPEMYNEILKAMYDYGKKVREKTKKEVIEWIKHSGMKSITPTNIRKQSKPTTK